MSHRWQRRLSRAVALAFLASGLTAALAEPAAAGAPQALVDLEQVSWTTATDAVVRKEATVDCPGTKVVVGTGWSTNPASAELVVEDLIPSTHSVTAVVREDETGYASTWSLTVYAWCAVRPPGWTIESGFSATNSNSWNDASADCPEGTVVLGLGFSQSQNSTQPGQTGQTVLTDADPSTSSVYALAYEDDTGYSGTWWVGAYAICAEAPMGWELVSSSNQTSYPNTTELTACSSTGRTAISSGGDLDNAFGEVTLKSLKTISYGGVGQGYASAGEDEDGTSSIWDLTNDVICVVG